MGVSKTLVLLLRPVSGGAEEGLEEGTWEIFLGWIIGIVEGGRRPIVSEVLDEI